MTRWLSSGLRRDICILIHRRGEPTGQSLKRALESHYERAISPSEFYGALETLVERGFAEKRPDGVHDRYALSAAGERGLRDHLDWVCTLAREA